MGEGAEAGGVGYATCGVAEEGSGESAARWVRVTARRPRRATGSGMLRRNLPWVASTRSAPESECVVGDYPAFFAHDVGAGGSAGLVGLRTVD